MPEFDLLILGDINPDVVLSGAGEPVFGQAETLVEDARTVIGGSGAITACAAARLGLRTAMVGVVGDDTAGHWMLSALSEAGVDTGGCIVDRSTPTGMSVILSRGDDRAILTSRGTMASLRASDVDGERLTAARHVHASSYFLQEALAPGLPSLFARARDARVSTSIDPNWDPSGGWDGGFAQVAELSSAVFVNATEALRLSGADDIEDAARSLATTAETVVVKLGESGALAFRGEERVVVPALKVKVLDTTGAGDTFDAGFLAGYLKDWPPERCVRLAVACGSLSTRAVGGTTAQPNLEEALEAMERP